MEQTPAFLNIDEHSLYMDLILVESRHPILFTCVDEDDGMYLGVCFRTDAQEKDWLISKTTPDQVISLLCNEISIRDAFPSGDSWVYLVQNSKLRNSLTVKYCRADEIPEEFFPIAGMFMDGDQDEFRQELSILRNRVAI